MKKHQQKTFNLDKHIKAVGQYLDKHPIDEKVLKRGLIGKFKFEPYSTKKL